MQYVALIFDIGKYIHKQMRSIARKVMNVKYKVKMFVFFFKKNRYYINDLRRTNIIIDWLLKNR